MSDSLHELQCARLLCPPLSPGVCSHSGPLTRWCHPTISSSVVPFSSCPVFPSIRVFSNKSALRIKWPKYWSFSFNISPSDEHPGLISFRMDWMDLLAVWGTLKSLLQHHSSKASINHRSLENQSINKKCLSGTDLYIVLWRNSGGIRNIKKSPEGLSGQLCNLWI